MIGPIRQFFRPKPTPSIPPGERIYAIGDIHGRRDLFEALIAAIERDDAEHEPADTTIILLGDLVDRGPDSAGVIDAARTLKSRRKLRIIAGNHEEMFLRSFDDTIILDRFLQFGGAETLKSYNVDPAIDGTMDVLQILDRMQSAIPSTDLDFIRAFESKIVVGDYLFVHAGIRPGVPIEEQVGRDMRWIREPFLSFSGNHGHIVVHGHTISEFPEIHENRVGIDTGAFMSGRLTALGIEGSERWLIATQETPGNISTSACPV